MNVNFFPRLKKIAARHRRFIRFCFVGLASTLIDIALLTLFVEIFKWPVILSNTLSFSCGAINSFICNKYWTFENKEKKIMGQVSKFLLITLIGLALNDLIIYILIRFGAWYLLAKIIATVIVIFWNFHGHRRVTFRRQSINNQPEIC